MVVEVPATAPLALKVTVLVDGVNVPLFVKLP